MPQLRRTIIRFLSDPWTGRYARLFVGMLFPTLLVASGCRDSTRPLVVGDGIARSPEQYEFLTVIAPILRTMTASELTPQLWAAPKDGFLGSEVGQAEVFASTENLIAVVGHGGSRNTLLTLPTYQAAGVPLIVPIATSAQLRHAGPLVYMMAPTDSMEGAFIADRTLDSLRLTRVAIVYVADAYGVGIRDGLAARLVARQSALTGGAAVSGRECDRRDRLAVRGIARSLVRRASPEVVVLGLPTALGGCIARELLAADSTLQIIATDSFEPARYRAELTERQRRAVHYVSFWDPGSDSLTQNFVATTRRVLGRDPTPTEALTYDAYLLVATAVSEGYRSRASLARWLSSLGTSSHPPVVGVTGPISFQRPREAALHLRAFPEVEP